MAKKKQETFYLVTYRDVKDTKVLMLKAKTVTDSTLGLSFIAISDFVFDTKSLVIDPGEEDQKRQFEGVKTLHLSIYSIVSIQEVGEKHIGLKFQKDKSNLVVLSTDQSQPKDK